MERGRCESETWVPNLHSPHAGFFFRSMTPRGGYPPALLGSARRGRIFWRSFFPSEIFDWGFRIRNILQIRHLGFEFTLFLCSNGSPEPPLAFLRPQDPHSLDDGFYTGQ